MAAYLLFGLIAFAIGFGAGWTDAHKTVARECKRLGSFYVGSETFDCRLRQPEEPR